MDETLFGWIHISDIHFGHGDASHGWDQKLVMAELRRDIAAKRTPVRVDAIFVTGDIAFSGAARSPDEYTHARGWLLETGRAVDLGPERIFLVPGNHDVNRDVDIKKNSTARLVKALRSRAIPETPIDVALKDVTDRGLLAGRMETYLDFAKNFGPWAGKDPMPIAEERLYWVHTLDGREGLRLRLLGLNTALLCKDDDDLGQLRLGNEQLRALADDRAPNEVIVALSHHPLRKGWLGDESNADKWIRNHAHAHLSGHAHEAESEGARSGSGSSFVRVAAGAAHNEQLPAWIPATHGYNFGEVRRGEQGRIVLRIHPRLWSPQKARFVLDMHSLPEDSSGAVKLFTEHELDVTLPATMMSMSRPPTVSVRAWVEEPSESMRGSGMVKMAGSLVRGPAADEDGEAVVAGAPIYGMPSAAPASATSDPTVPIIRPAKPTVRSGPLALGVAILTLVAMVAMVIGVIVALVRRTDPVSSVDANHICGEKDLGACESQCKGGDTKGCDRLNDLAFYYKNRQDYSRATQLYKQACDVGSATGCGGYGDLLMSGSGIAVNRVSGLFGSSAKVGPNDFADLRTGAGVPARSAEAGALALAARCTALGKGASPPSTLDGTACLLAPGQGRSRWSRRGAARSASP